MKFPRIFSFVLLVLTAMTALPQMPPGASLPDARAMSALGNDLFLQSGSTGMVLVIVRGDQVFFEGYGETSPGSHQLPNQDSLLRLCSLTKIFTTDVLTKLVADKTVRLDDPLQRFAPAGVLVPEVVQARARGQMRARGQGHGIASQSARKRVNRDGVSPNKPITLEELATHTSGLPRELGNAARGTAHFTFPDYRTRWRWLPNQHLGYAPGTAAVYSNVAYDFLGDAIQAAAHEQYAAVLSARTLSPLHMRQTTYFPNVEQCRRLLISAGDQGPCTVTEATAGSSGLYSTAADMTTWLTYLIGTWRGGIPAQDAAAQAIYLEPSALVSQKGLDHAGEPTGIGLGWIHILPVDSASHLVEKTGGGAGFSTYIAIVHSRHTALFLAATDGSESHLNLFNAANKLLLAVAGLPPLPPPEPRPPRRAAHRRSRR